MKGKTLLTCLLALAAAMPMEAQRKKKTPRADQTQSVEQLIQNYRFDEAESLVQKEIKKAQKEGKSTERLEADMQRAILGADMLRGMERVAFIDSFKVARKDVLAALKLSADAGSLLPAATQSGKFRQQPAELGSMACINDLRDRIFFSAATEKGGVKNIHAAYRSGKGWGTAAIPPGLANEAADQDFPFVMPDGVTLYYAAQGEGSLGGYDLFVTRYNPETKQYLKAENLGMPFNSPANDYMLVIDETVKLGWLVSDRYQQPDSACVYVFVPNESREIYEVNNETRDQVVALAKLQCIADTQYDEQLVKDARQRLRKVSEQRAAANERKHRYVINNRTVYTNLSQFKSQQARDLASQSDEVKYKIEELSERQDELMLKRATQQLTPKEKGILKQLNQNLLLLNEQYNTLTKQMRIYENK